MIFFVLVKTKYLFTHGFNICTHTSKFPSNLRALLCSLNKFLLIFLFYFMNIYVGNLSYKVRENDLQGVMEEYGTVDSCKIITDRETGKSKGFAFVEMSDDAAATKVIEELNGAEFDGRTMVVKEARPRA